MTTRGLRKGSQGGSVAIAGIAYKDKGDVTTNRFFLLEYKGNMNVLKII